MVVLLMFCFFTVQVAKPQETLVTAVEVLNPDLELIRQGSFPHLSMDFHHRVWCSGGGKQWLHRGYNASMCMWWCAVLINPQHTFSSKSQSHGKGGLSFKMSPSLYILRLQPAKDTLCIVCGTFLKLAVARSDSLFLVAHNCFANIKTLL